MTQPSAATAWLDLSLLIWPDEIQDLVYSNQKKNWKWTEVSSEQPPLNVKTLSGPYFLSTGNPEPFHSQIWTSSTLLLDHRPPDPSSQVRSETSGQTEACNSLSGEIFLLPRCKSSILAEVQGQCCHPTLLPAVPKATLCHIHVRLSPSISLPSLGLSQGKRNSVFWQELFIHVYPPVPPFLTLTCTVPFLFFNSGPAFSLIGGMESPRGFR